MRWQGVLSRPVKAANLLLTSTRNRWAQRRGFERRPTRVAARMLSSVRSVSDCWASRCAANGCMPAPNRARMCSAVSASPTCKPSIPVMPDPAHTPGDSPRSAY
jgi:hypothetical protein